MNFSKEFKARDFTNYVNKGEGEGKTLTENRKIFAQLKIVPRILNDISNVEMSIKDSYGENKHPFVIGPTAFHKFACDNGEIETAKAASATSTPYVVSCYASAEHSEILNFLESKLYWQQTYLFNNRNITEAIIKRAESNNARGIVITVGASKRPQSRRNNDWKYPKSLAEIIKLVYGEDNQANVDLAKDKATWDEIKWLKRFTNLPIVLKGVLDINDAKKAKNQKINGIVITNHGGRQLDDTVSSLRMLNDINKRLGNRMDLYYGDGIECGLDAVKAFALGAKRIYLGKPILWKLNEGGSLELEKYINELINDTKAKMEMSGCRTINQLQELCVSEG